MDYTKYETPEYYVNRELSWIKFDERVLSEARDKTLPLFERLKFLSITASNLDEFFMIRVASLKDQVHAKYTKPDIAGLSPKEQLKEISERTHELVQQQYSTYNRSLVPALNKISMNVIMEHEEDIGWDILIRMELLTPLIERTSENPMVQDEIIKLGIDMCKALEFCRKIEIIHRDIKPENIFITSGGDYKLGDFGIAKTVEKTRIGLSRKGTYAYMAP